MVDTLPKKESFQFSFSYKISMNVILELPNYSVLGCAFLVGHSPFLVLLEWGKLSGHVAKKESFQFCFSYKISMNVTLEPRRHYSVLARPFLVGHWPLLVLLEWGKLDGEFVWTCYQKRIFSALFLIQNFHKCNLRAMARWRVCWAMLKR